MTTAAPHATTAPPTCDTDGCTSPAETVLRLVRSGRTFNLCEPDARRSYDAVDRNRRGGKVEFHDLPHAPQLRTTTPTGRSLTDVILSAYAQLATYPCAPVRLSALRAHLRHHKGRLVDAALRELADNPAVHLRAEEDQASLTARDRAASLLLGGLDRHNLQVEGLGGH